MTRPLEDVYEVFDLAAAGLSKRAISMRTGIARASIREWLDDPAKALARGKGRGVGLTCAGACEPWIDIDEPTYAYLLGMYLGDGCIATHPRSYRIRIACCDDYPLIMDEVEDAIRKVGGNSVCRVQCIGCTEVSSYSQHWPCFFPQHGPGAKHARAIALTEWQSAIVERHPQPFIRGLIQSDGWRGENVAIRTRKNRVVERRFYSRYQFTNKSDDIREMFCWALDLIGVHWTQSNKWTISVARRKDVHYLDSFVGPKR